MGAVLLQNETTRSTRRAGHPAADLPSPDDTGGLIARIASTLDRCGRGEIWPALVDLVCGDVGFDQAAAVLYPAARPPARVFDTVATDQRDRLYRTLIGGAYLLSPYYMRFIASRGPSGFYPIDEVAPDDFGTSDYHRIYYSEKQVVDEGLFHVAPARNPHLSAVLIVERVGASQAFSPHELQRLKGLAPLVSALVSHFVTTTTAADEAASRRVSDLFGTLGLTGREGEVAELILQGHSSKSAARVLAISPGTERVHRRRLYQKLKISSHADLFRMVIGTHQGRTVPP